MEFGTLTLCVMNVQVLISQMLMVNAHFNLVENTKHQTTQNASSATTEMVYNGRLKTRSVCLNVLILTQR